ncbi:hypothetical protein ACWEMW_33740 [Streptomyces sp. NPDC004684]
MLINNASQARRERAARDAERTRTLADRRETFELAHLQDLHAELSELLLVAEDNINQWCAWHRLSSRTPTRRRTAEDLARQLGEIRAAADELERITNEHREKINRLAGLVIPDRLRIHVINAHMQYEQLSEILVEDGPDAAQNALPSAIAKLHGVQREVADRIREIYVAHEPGMITSTARRSTVARRPSIVARRRRSAP